MNKLSSVLITYNEADKVERALGSLRSVSDEIVVVDSFSSDDTPNLCRRHTPNVIQRAWEGYRDQKQFATDQASHEWVLSLDADEALSPELIEEISRWKTREAAQDGYYISRKPFFMGRWIEHTTWHPDWQLRLFRKTRSRWRGGRIHETVHVEGPTGRLRGEIFHHTYTTFSEYLHQLERFSSLAAQDQFEAGRRAKLRHFLLYPPAVFLKNYLLRRGFLDGLPGLTVSFLAAISTLFRSLKLWELQAEPPDRLPADSKTG